METWSERLLLWFSTRLFAPAIFLDTREPALLQTFLSSKTGVFVEVGANDPIVGSQTYALEQRGWSGLLVEPLREYADQLRSKEGFTPFVVRLDEAAPSGAK